MNIDFTWTGGATWILKIDSLKIACDPVLCPKGHVQDYKIFKTIRQNEPVFKESDFFDTNIFLLTHNHEDHLDETGLRAIPSDSKIIAHKSLRKKLIPAHKTTVFLSWNRMITIQKNDFTIEVIAVPAIHAKKRLFGPIIGNGNGYVLIISNGAQNFNLYVTGDSVYHKTIHPFLPACSFDLVVANAGAATIGNSILSKLIGRITNNITDISALCAGLKPRLLVPVHWGTFSHYKELFDKNSIDSSLPAKILSPGEHIFIEMNSIT